MICGEPIDGFVGGGTVNSDVGDGIAPKVGVSGEEWPGCDGAPCEEADANVADAGFDFPFFPASADITGDRFKEVGPGEVHKARVKANVPAQAGKDDGFKVVIEDFLGDPTEKTESVDVTSEKILEALGEGEFQVDHAGIGENHHKTRKFAQSGPDAEGPAVRPVDLSLFAWESFDTEEDIGGFGAENAKVVFENGEPTGIAHPPQFGKDLNGGKVGVFFDSLGQVRCERVQLGGPNRYDAGRRGLLESKSATDGLTIDVELSGNVCPGELVHFKKTADGGPEVGIHERYST